MFETVGAYVLKSMCGSQGTVLSITVPATSYETGSLLSTAAYKLADLWVLRICLS